MNDVTQAEIAALRNSGRFDEQWYLEQYRDVKLLGMGAAEHYLWVGAKLGRLPKAPPRVSVVIPTRNSAKYIRESIDSILNQTFVDFEILVVDDNSSDDTRAILTEYRDCRLTVLNGPGRGLAAALNYGMRQSRSEFIARMDADDIAHNTRLQRQVEYLDANPQLGVCGTLFQEFMGGDALHDHMENVRYADLLDGCYVGHPTAMLRRALFAEHDLFYNESLQFSEDYDLWSRAIRITEIGNVRENLLQYRRHGESASRSNVGAMTNLDVDIKVGMIDYLVGGVSLEQRECLRKLFRNENVPEAQRQNLVIDIADSIKYPALCSSLDLISLFHRLKEFDDAFIDKVTARELHNLPIFVISFNHLTHLKSIVEFFQKEGISNVAIIDNNSTYPPLVDFLKTVPYKVYRMSRNYGHMVLFDNPLFKDIVDNKYFALTDPDILPEAACPKEYLSVFMKILLQRPMKNKVGFSLKIDDLPQHYELRDNVIAWESGFYKREDTYRNIKVYDAPIDTTFALYRPRKEWRTRDFYSAIRVGAPYTARHLPWYRDLRQITAEELYYKKLDKGVSNWNGTMGSDQLHKKYGTAAQLSESGKSVKRICLFAGYSSTRTVDDYVLHYVEHLSRHSDVYYCADSDMPEQELAKLDSFVKGRWSRRHEKYDFGSWQKLIHMLGWSEIEKYDALLLANDSNYGPVSDLGNVFMTMDRQEFDFWGITQNNGVHIHVQSYFINLYRKAFASEEFKEFVSNISKEKTKTDICIKYEIGLSKLLYEKGLSLGVYIDRAKTDVPFGADISAFQNTLIRAGSPFVKRKIFFDESFAEESVSQTWELLRACGYPESLIVGHTGERPAGEARALSTDDEFSSIPMPAPTAGPVAAGAAG